MVGITPQEAVVLFENLYKDQISQLEKFELKSYHDCDAYYELFLERRINDYLYDSILLKTNKEGEVLWFNVFYCGLEEITDTQRQKLKELFENHVEQWQSSAIDYDADVSYWKADDMILAEYSVIYQYADGTEYGELLDFAIEG